MLNCVQILTLHNIDFLKEYLHFLNNTGYGKKKLWREREREREKRVQMCLLGVCQKFSNDDLAVIQYSLCTIDSFLGYQKQKVCVCVYVCVYVCVCVREKEIVRMENKRAEIEEDASQICFIHSSMLMYTHGKI